MVSLLWWSSHPEQLFRVLPQTIILGQVHGGKQIVLLTARSQAEHCRCHTSILSHASIQRFDQDAGQAGRQRKPCEALFHAAVCSNAIEQQLSGLNGPRGWSIQPMEIIERDLHRPDAEEELREIVACDLGSGVLPSQQQFL